jgi:transposase-like protein
MSRRGVRYSDEEKAKAMELLKDHTYKEVSDLTGINIVHLRRLFKKTGMSRESRRRIYSNEENAKAIELLENYSYSEVSSLTGMSHDYLYRLLKKAGKTKKTHMNKYSNEDKARALELLKSYSFKEVSEMTGIKYQTLATFKHLNKKSFVNDDEKILDAILLLNTPEENTIEKDLLVAARSLLKNRGPA